MTKKKEEEDGKRLSGLTEMPYFVKKKTKIFLRLLISNHDQNTSNILM